MIIIWWGVGIGGSWCRLLWATMVTGGAVLTLRGIRPCWVANKSGVVQEAHNVCANDGPALIRQGLEADRGLPRLGKFSLAALDFADDRVLPAFTHDTAQESLKRAANRYKKDFLTSNVSKTVLLIYDPTGVIQYNNGDNFYTRLGERGRFVLTLNGAPLCFVDRFKYLGVFILKTGDCQPAADAACSAAKGKMWAVQTKIRSLFTLPSSFTLMSYKALVQSTVACGAEL